MSTMTQAEKRAAEFRARLGREPTSAELHLADTLGRLPNRAERREAGIGIESGSFEVRVMARTDAHALTKAARKRRKPPA